MAFTEDQVLSLEAAFDQGFAKSFMDSHGFLSDEDKYNIALIIADLADKYYCFPDTLKASSLVWALLRELEKDMADSGITPDSLSEDDQKILETVEFVRRLQFWLQADFREPERS